MSPKGSKLVKKMIKLRQDNKLTDLAVFFRDLMASCGATNGKSGKHSTSVVAASLAADGASLTDREAKIADQILKEVIIRCDLLLKVGLNYELPNRPRGAGFHG